MHDGARAQAEQPHAGHYGQHAQDDSDDGPHCCTCIGSCLSATPAAVPTAALRPVPDEPGQVATAYPGADAARTTPLPRLLPFATAPPRA